MPDPECIFAMKAEAARIGTSDIDDLKALIRNLTAKHVAAVLAIVERCVPSGLRSMRSQLTLEAIFEDLAPARPRQIMSWSVVTLTPAPNAGAHLARSGRA